ncbi:hypothetical protein HYH02_015565, partial [Chlamydomonas schloesseri]
MCSRRRSTHVVLRRLLHISLALMQNGDSGLAGGCGGGSAPAAAALTDQFVRRVSSAFHSFLAHVEDSCKERCLEDLASTTRYVSWSLHTRNSRSLKQLLGRVRVTGSDSSSSCGGSHPISTGGPGAVSKAGGAMGAGAPGAGLSREPSMTGGVGGGQAGSLSLPDMLEATLWNRNLTGVSEDIVRALVLQMFEGIRDHLVQ